MRSKLYVNIDKNKQNPKKGFTLIELLAVIVITTLIGAICTYSIVNMINNSKKETLAITENNIKKTAATYTKEKEGIVWVQDPTSENTLLSCINIQELINEGYFKEEILNNEIIKTKNIEYIIIKKDAQSLTITDEDFDNSGICQKTFNYVTTPSCNNNLTYNGKEQKLIDETSNNNLIFTNNTQTNAGKYQVNLTPKKGYVWENGTNSTINKTCKIQKAKINIKLEPNSAIGQDKTTYTTIATPYIVNNNELITTGNIFIKSLNEQNAIASPNTINNVNTNTQNLITINANSNRNSDTIITITFNPIDTKNYESGTNTFTLGDSSSGTSNIYQITLNPNGGSLGNNPNSFFATKGKEYGTNLDVIPTRTGYTFKGWYTKKEDGTKVTSTSTFNYDENITLYAHWSMNSYTVVFNGNGATEGSTENKTCTYNQDCTLTNNGFTKTGYKFLGWSTYKDGPKEYNNGQTIKLPYTEKTLNLYAKWQRNFTCSATGGTTQYMGKSWYTVSNNGSTCALALNELVGNSNGNNFNTAEGTGSGSVYSYIKNYTNGINTFAEEKAAGLITGHSSASNTNIGITSKKPFWIRSETIYLPKKYSVYKFTSSKLYYGHNLGQSIKASKPQSKSVYGQITTEYTNIGNKQISNTSTNYEVTNGAFSKNKMPIASDSYTTFYITSSDGSNLNLTKESYRNNDNLIETNYANKYGYKFYDCGGTYNGKHSVTLKANGNANKYTFVNKMNDEEKEMSINTWYHTFAARVEVERINGNFNEWDFSTGGYCEKEVTYYTPKNAKYPIMYRPFIKVKI